MNIIEDINNYCEEHSTPLNSILSELITETQNFVPGAHMLTGQLVGNLLSMISQMLNPKYIIELGTYTGFSAICLAQGLSENGKLYTIDTDDRWQNLREKYWEKSGLKDKIAQIIGPGLEALEQLNITPTLAFIDADKGNYWNYTDILISKMPSGSWIIVDNVLFKNEVISEDIDNISKTAKHIKSYNDQLIQDQRVDIVMLPIRDGVTIIKIK